jgi:hypothetical protein
MCGAMLCYVLVITKLQQQVPLKGLLAQETTIPLFEGERRLHDVQNW